MFLTFYQGGKLGIQKKGETLPGGFDDLNLYAYILQRDIVKI